ncbi:apolipoprotein N-acyltransferase [Actinospica sp. MGRD01-02]|uniref:Apolipoprotein N-acyltransferase n=1 Tax=Actinospica acidithermotolerans TaxID=2828514 RepID=A0A941EEP2_9ACTN|nr:apolipoprotein N-acyltransferase [Actinospica acidithermotolerans]MBR7830101.1 apolipoprotein N-acyltransferase [Actinospica acidithermotolerans]
MARLWRPRRPRPGRAWLPHVGSFASGALLYPAFAPIGWWWLAPIAVAGFTLNVRAAYQGRLSTERRRPWAAAAWAGFWFGLAFCYTIFRWVDVIGVDALVFLGLVEALYFAPLGAAVASVSRLRFAAFWQALLWVAEEFFRDRWPLGGFSWGRLAFSQTQTPLTAIVALGGAPLLSFATALVGTVLAALVLRLLAARRRLGEPGPGWAGAVGWRGSLAWVGAALVLPIVGNLVPIQTIAHQPVELAAVQGDVPRTGLDAYGQAYAVLDNHAKATEQYAAEIAAGKAKQPVAVFWPEDSDDVDPYADPEAYAIVSEAVQSIGVQTLVGAVVDVGSDKAKELGIVWDPNSGPGATYAKRHLVPFGEYIPWRAELTKYFSEMKLVPRDFVSGNTPGVLTVGGVKIATVICYEVAYDDMVRSSVLGDGGVLVVQTNNATYGWTDQPSEQMAITQLRAVETGRPVMVAATSGISGYIDASGHIVKETRQFTAAVVSAEVTPRTGQTLAIRLGAAPEWAMMGLGLLAWAWAAAAGRRRRRVETAFATAGQSGAADPGIARPEVCDGAVTASAGGGAQEDEATVKAVSSLPAPASSSASSTIVSNARKAHP